MLSQKAEQVRSQTSKQPPSPTNSPSPRPSLKSPQRKNPSPKNPSPSRQRTIPSQQQKSQRPKPKRPGRKLLAFDRRLGARFVAGTDEAGRGSLAGPLVVAGVLLDYGSLRDHRVRPLAQLNDSKQVSPEDREELFRAVLDCAAGVSVQVVSPGEIDRA